MIESHSPHPYQPESLLELVDEDTLEHLITGFRERLKMGVALYCKDLNGKLKRIDPEKDGSAGREKHWSEVCKRFRAVEAGERACCQFDEQIVSEFLGDGERRARAHLCKPLGLTDMAAQVRVWGKPLGVVLAGQRLRPGRPEEERIRTHILEHYPERAAELQAALTQEYAAHGAEASSAAVCNDAEIERLLEGLEDFGKLIAAICQPVAQREMEVKRAEFLEHWINKLTEARPTHLTAWGRHLHACLSQFRAFVSPAIERIGFFHGQCTGEAVLYSLVAMNSSNWWHSEPFSVPVDVFSEPRDFARGALPDVLGPGVGLNLAESKCFHVFPFREEAPSPNDGDPAVLPEEEDSRDIFSPIHSLVMIQSRDELSDDMHKFCRRFCSDLCRRDATTRLFIRQLEASRDFQQHILEKRHDLRTSLQHVVDTTGRLIREMRQGTRPTSCAGKELVAMIKHSVKDHASQVAGLNGRPAERRHPELNWIDLYSTVREQADLYASVAAHRGITIDCSALPQEEAPVLCERVELARAIAALLDNAIKYSYKDHYVGVGGQLSENQAQLSIHNYGIGIPPDLLAKITKRTVRAHVPDPMRHREGTGLGLAIAAYVFVDILGGKLTPTSKQAKNVPGETDEFHRYVTKFTVSIPRDLGEH